MSPRRAPRSRRPGWPILFGIAVAAGVLGTLLWLASEGRRRGPARGGPTESARSSSDDPAPIEAAEPSHLAPPDAPVTSEPGRERQPLAARVSAGSPSGPEPALAPGEGLEIRVVTGAPATPVPGAVVAFIDERSVVDEDMLEVRAGTLTLDQILERVGRRFRADEHGLVTVPVPRGFGFVAGGTAELWGLLEFAEDETDLVLTLEPDPLLVVRVVDAEGRPAGGVPVAFRQRYEQFVQDLFATDSAPGTGLATLRHIRRFVEEKRQDGQTFVALAVLCETPVEVAIDPASFPEETLELVLPPSGSVELRIEDADGRPFDAPVVVRMVVVRMVEQQPDARGPAAFERDERVHRVAEGGRLFVPHVGLGLDLALLLEAQGYAPLSLEHRGPGDVGERVTIRATLEERVPSLTGIAVDAEGKPLAGVSLAVRLTLETAENKTDRTHSRLRTDEEGRFRQALPPSWDQLGGRLVFELETEDAAGRELAAIVPLPGRPLPGENDLGPVVLEPPPLIAAGAVVDPEGLPVAGAKVVLAVPRARDLAPGEPAHWRSLWEHNTRSDRTGAFEFRGVLDEPRIAVSATHPDHSGSRRIEAAPGSSGLRVVLTRAGRLAGSLLVDEGVSFDLFSVQAQHESEPRTVYHAAVRKDGTFELTSMDEGPYRLTVALRDEAGCGEVIEGVPVRAGQASDDERLQAIDLRGRIRIFTVEVVNEAGTPLMQGALSRKTPETAEFGSDRIWLRGGQAKIATCLPALDLEIDVPGYRTQLLERVAEDRRVTMTRGPRLSIVLANTPALKPDAELGVQVRLAEPGRWKPTQTTWIENGHALLHAKAAGTHELTVIYAEVSEGARRSHALSSGPEARIEVADSSELQEFVIELSEATLRRLEEL